MLEEKTDEVSYRGTLGGVGGKGRHDVLVDVDGHVCPFFLAIREMEGLPVDSGHTLVPGNYRRLSV